MSPKSALIAGATGLVGTNLLALLLESTDYEKVVVLSRRPLEWNHRKLTVVQLDFPRPKSWGPLVCDHFFCCLGTTMKAAGSRTAFRVVDLDLVIELASAVSEGNPAATAVVVSALGADADSQVFYNRVKGEMEQAVAALPLAGAVFLRPSLLAGPRKDFRLGERLGLMVARMTQWAWFGPIRKYRSIPADQVAKAMLIVANQQGQSRRFIESDRIRALASGEAICD